MGNTWAWSAMVIFSFAIGFAVLIDNPEAILNRLGPVMKVVSMRHREIIK